MFFDKIRRSIKIVVIVVALAFVASVFWDFGRNVIGRGAVDSSVVARIGKQRIGVDEFYQVFSMAMEQQRGYFGTVRPDEVEAIKAYTLSQIIDHYLMLKAIEEKKIKAPEEQVAEKMGEFKKQFPSDEAYKEWLDNTGYTEKMIAEIFAEDLKKEKLIETVTMDVTVTDEEVAKAFEEIKEEGEKLEDKKEELQKRLMEVKRAEKFDEWLSDYRKKSKVVIVDPQIAGYNHLVAGEYSDAIKKYEEALKTYGEDPYIYTSLARAYMGMGEKEKGIAMYKKALSLREDDPYLHLLLGNAYLEIDDKDNALSAYKKASELAKGNSYEDLMLHYDLKNIYSAREWKEEASHEEGIISRIFEAMAPKEDASKNEGEKGASNGSGGGEGEKSPTPTAGGVAQETKE